MPTFFHWRGGQTFFATTPAPWRADSMTCCSSLPLPWWLSAAFLFFSFFYWLLVAETVKLWLTFSTDKHCVSLNSLCGGATEGVLYFGATCHGAPLKQASNSVSSSLVHHRKPPVLFIVPYQSVSQWNETYKKKKQTAHTSKCWSLCKSPIYLSGEVRVVQIFPGWLWITFWLISFSHGDVSDERHIQSSRFLLNSSWWKMAQP